MRGGDRNRNRKIERKKEFMTERLKYGKTLRWKNGEMRYKDRKRKRKIGLLKVFSI